ncbi:MAG: hypothetical protein IT442_06975 [Phycisphaeraceae bacterium]|nr:hypothetical protein [Phycisphaeraceae bacterium]
MSTDLVASVRPGLLQWLETVRNKEHGWGRWRYHARTLQPWSLKASGMAIGLLNNFDALGGISKTQREEAIEYLLSCQDPRDGWFKDPLETEEYYTGHHTWPQVWGQRHASAVEALTLLGAQPRYPLPAAQFADLSTVNGRQWTLEQLDWRNPWMRGEDWSRAIRAFLRSMPADQQHDRYPTLAAAFEALENDILDPATGLPSRRMPEFDADTAIAGLFKVMMAYVATGRPVPHATQAIDFILAHQEPTGEFSTRRNMCLNWDPMWVLWNLDKQLNGRHRHADILAAGRRLAAALMADYRKPDGAFAMHREDCLTTHHSIRLCDQPYPIGDMLGTMMCLQCLSYVDAWNGVAGKALKTPA